MSGHQTADIEDVPRAADAGQTKVNHRSGRRPAPNLVLIGLLRDLGWSRAGFAQRVLDRCEQTGVHATVSSSTVDRWCSGETHQPSADLARAACHVLSVALSRAVAPAALGWGPPGSDTTAAASLEYQDVPHALSTLPRLWALDATHSRRLFSRYQFVPAAFTAAAGQALVMPPDAELSGRGSRRVRSGDVELISHQTELYARLDAEYGGGRYRRPFAAFLDAHATGLLVGSYSPRAGTHLLAAVADASVLLGFMAYDDQQLGVAQRYATQALCLAHAIEDPCRVARVLIHAARITAADKGADRQIVLTHARSAVLAADAGPHLVRAYAAITEARAWAYNRNPTWTLDAVDRARTALRRAHSGDAPPWLAWLDEYELEGQAAWALVVAGLRIQGADALEIARSKPAALARDNIGLLINAAELARLKGDLDQYAELTAQAAQRAGGIDSRRTAARIEKLRQGVPLDCF